MGKQKQQVISRFFAPKSKSPPHTHTPTPTPTPKITATVAFSPSKRRLTSDLTPPPKHAKLQNTSSPALHQRFLNKLLEPPSPSSSSKPPTYTPLEQQFLDLKAKHPDVLLMVEVGYKYRFFAQDAEHAARVLGIYAHLDHNFLTASIPTFRLNVHLRRLVTAGYKVGVVRQTETAAIKAHGSNRSAPFSRGLSALYTKATLEAATDSGGGSDAQTNYLLCVVENGDSAAVAVDVTLGIVAVEISTGDLLYAHFGDGFLRSSLEALLVSLSPAELLLGGPLSNQTEKLLLDFAGPASNVRVERVSRDCFTDGGALAEVLTFYESMCVDSPSDSMQSKDSTENRSQQLVIKELL